MPNAAKKGLRPAFLLHKDVTPEDYLWQPTVVEFMRRSWCDSQAMHDTFTPLQNPSLFHKGMTVRRVLYEPFSQMQACKVPLPFYAGRVKACMWCLV